MQKLVIVVVAVLPLVGVQAVQAIEPGERAGPLQLLTLEGGELILSNYDERPATAVLFLSGRCDVTDGAIDAINALYVKYRLRNVLYVGVCANGQESSEALRGYAQHRGMIFPVYRDPQGAVARQLGARVTPEVFLLDRKSTLLFHGGLGTDEGRQSFEAAIVSTLGKQSIEVALQPADGTPIDQPGAKRELGSDAYGAPVVSSELIFERISFAPAHHCSTICQAGNGDLLCVWYGGSYESSDDQVLFLSRRPEGRRAWSEPEVVLSNPGQPPGNAVVFRDGSDRIWIVWGRMESTRPLRRGSGWGKCRLMARTSNDHGATWSADAELIDGTTVWGLPRNPPFTLSDGTLVLPLSGRLGDARGSHFLKLARDAAAWQPGGFARGGGSQPTAIERGDGSVLALFRRSKNIGEMESPDGGATWSETRPTALKNPNSGISMTKLANGHLVLVFNDSESSRTPLNIVRSVDEGRTWEQTLDLESNPGEYSYPCVIQAADGGIHVTYTFRRYSIKHVELNEEWLTQFERAN